MAVKIGHASIAENGKATCGKPGDQTGKEICIRDWYAKGWNVYLECTDSVLADKAASIMEQICKNDSYGYCQTHRWAGYQSIVANGKRISGGKGDFDCSSLIIACYILAGLQIKADGYTGNMRRILQKTGKFKVHTESQYLTSDKYAKRGGIYLKEGSHVVMSLENGSNSTEQDVPAGNITAAGYLVKVTASVLNVRKGPGTNYGIVKQVRNGETCIIVGEERNGSTVWGKLESGAGYISLSYTKRA